jgi:hypothetical protein
MPLTTFSQWWLTPLILTRLKTLSGTPAHSNWSTWGLLSRRMGRSRLAQWWYLPTNLRTVRLFRGLETSSECIELLSLNIKAPRCCQQDLTITHHGSSSLRLFQPLQPLKLWVSSQMTVILNRLRKSSVP